MTALNGYIRAINNGLQKPQNKYEERVKSFFENFSKEVYSYYEYNDDEWSDFADSEMCISFENEILDETRSGTMQDLVSDGYYSAMQELRNAHSSCDEESSYIIVQYQHECRESWEHYLTLQVDTEKSELEEYLNSDQHKVLIVECSHMSVFFNEDTDGFEVSVTVSEKDFETGELLREIEEEFTVQLAGGKYLPQVGCEIFSHDGDYANFEYREGGAFYPFSDSIIMLAEYEHERRVQERLEEDEGYGVEWEHYETKYFKYLSATAYEDIIIEKSEDGCFRVYPEIVGHISPNDYASPTDFFVEYFVDQESLEDFLEDRDCE